MTPLLEIPKRIATYSLDAIGSEITSSAVTALSSLASAINPVTSTAYFVPFCLGHPVSVSRVFSINGTTAQGSIDVGIYDEDGTYIISSGSTTQTGTSNLQFVTITNTVIGPGRFYLAVSLNTTQGTILRGLWTTTTQGTIAGMKYLFDTFPLPTTGVTFTNLTNTYAVLPFRALAYIPVIGFTTAFPGQ